MTMAEPYNDTTVETKQNSRNLAKSLSDNDFGKDIFRIPKPIGKVGKQKE